MRWSVRHRTLLLVGVPMLVGLVHVWVVSHRYFVGSFDDDASYVMSAQAMAHGVSLDGHLPSGALVAGAYPPGYPFLLVPLFLIWPHTYTPERLFSTVCFAAVFPLLWIYLGRRKLGDPVRFATLALLAASPVMATYGSMIMAEGPFLVLLLVLLLVTEGWRPGRGSRTLGLRGIGVVVAAAGLVWLKEAGVGIVLGLALWYLLHKDWRKTAAILGGFVLLLIPFLVARHLGGAPLAGTRYTEQLGSFYEGNPILKSIEVLPGGFFTYFNFALPRTILYYGSPIPPVQPWLAIYTVVAWQFSILTVLGFCITVRRHRDAAVVAIPFYVFETMVYPDVNERRVILILPIVAAWYVLGLRAAVRWLLARIEVRRAAGAAGSAGAVGSAGAGGAAAAGVGGRLGVRSAPVVGLGLAAVLVFGVPFGLQFSRDYLYASNRTSSRPGGSRYMSILAASAPASAVVETDYESTTGLYTGHLTANGAFIEAITTDCDPRPVRRALASDHAGWLLVGTLNKPGVVDSECLFHLAASNPSWAVRLLRTNRDQASVFELIGPGTAHPNLRDLVATAKATSTAPLGVAGNFLLAPGDVPGPSTVAYPVDGTGVVTWTWPDGAGSQVSQVSIGEVKPFHGGTLTNSTLEVRQPDGRWVAVADAPGIVGDLGAPYLFGQLPAGTKATAMRLVFRSTGPVVVTDVHALGS